MGVAHRRKQECLVLKALKGRNQYNTVIAYIDNQQEHTEKELLSKNTELFLKSIRSNMMNDTCGISYSALSGLDGFSFTIHTGLHPVLTDSALAGQKKFRLVALDLIDWILLFQPRNLSELLAQCLKEGNELISIFVKSIQTAVKNKTKH